MGFTIEDMNLMAKDRYQMEFIAGKRGWSNSISWVLMMEDTAIIRNFAGKELAVTTGLGFDTEEKLLGLARKLVVCHASGLIINTGEYIHELPQSLCNYCDENDLPLMTVPWEVYLSEMIKDLSIRIFLQGTTDEEITRALIHAIEEPDNQENYRKILLPYLDIDGEFQVVLFTTGGLDEMDTVNFVLIMNDVSRKDFEEIVDGMISRTKRRMPEVHISVGAGSKVVDITNLRTAYQRAKAAVNMAQHMNCDIVHFDDMGIYRLLYSVSDKAILKEMSEELLQPLLAYDAKHNSNYVEVLEKYLEYNGSIQAVAEAMYTHRNTIIYRVTNIKKLLGTELDTTEERFQYQMAYYIRKM